MLGVQGERIEAGQVHGKGHMSLVSLQEQSPPGGLRTALFSHWLFPRPGAMALPSPSGLHKDAGQQHGPFCPWTALSETARFPHENCLFWIRLPLVS